MPAANKAWVAMQGEQGQSAAIAINLKLNG